MSDDFCYIVNFKLKNGETTSCMYESDEFNNLRKFLLYPEKCETKGEFFDLLYTPDLKDENKWSQIVHRSEIMQVVAIYKNLRDDEF